MSHFNYSPQGLALTKQSESLRLTAYQDTGHVWTIGYGHTGPEVHQGLTITEAQADAYLAADIAWAVAAVNGAVTAAINQNQFDALVDFCFNVGKASFLGSTLLHDVNAGNFTAAAKQFGEWIHVKGKVVNGLVNRRKAEAALFSTPVPAQSTTA